MQGAERGETWRRGCSSSGARAREEPLGTPPSVCQRERCPARRVWRNGWRNGVGSRHGHSHDRARRSRYRSRHRRDPVRSLITLPLAVSEEEGRLKLALRPTVPARERYYANPRPARRGNAPLRQTGSTVGPVFWEGLPSRAVRRALGRACRRAGRGSWSAWGRTRSRPTNAKRCQRPIMRARRALPLQSGVRALKRGLAQAKAGERSMPTERHRCGVATRLLALQARRVSVCPRAGQISGRAAEAQMVRTRIRSQR
jgi:hypothetical protein